MPRYLLAAALLFGTPALAQDSLDDLPEADFGDDRDEEAAPQGEEELPSPSESEDDELEFDEEPPLTEEDTPSDDEGSDEFDFEDSPGDLLDEEDPDAVGEGEDTVDVYRATADELEDLGAEERMTGWSDYLARYPNTMFREQIAREIERAESELYGEGIQTNQDVKVSSRGLLFPEPLFGENPNPATRVKLGFDWGVPAWINLIADAEYALSSNFSGHIAMRQRYQGWSLELGPRYALVKTDNTIVSAVGDLHLGINPSLIGLRPTVVAGQILFDRLYVQGQVSPEWQRVSGYWTFYGAASGSVTYRASKAVGMFVEGTMAGQYFGWPGGTLHFHTVGFGMRFYPSAKGVSSNDKNEVLFGAAVPMSWNQWNFHKGAASVQTNLYLD